MIEREIDQRGRFGTSWLIVRDDVGDEGGTPEVLTLGAEGGAGRGEKTLPVFSFEEEALLFLRLSGLADGWRASMSGIADLASVLAGPCSDAGRVALDPIPERGRRRPHDLVSLPREAFVALLAAERRTSARRGAPAARGPTPRRGAGADRGTPAAAAAPFVWRAFRELRRAREENARG